MKRMKTRTTKKVFQRPSKADAFSELETAMERCEQQSERCPTQPLLLKRVSRFPHVVVFTSAFKRPALPQSLELSSIIEEYGMVLRTPILQICIGFTDEQIEMLKQHNDSNRKSRHRELQRTPDAY
ncbi:hypothetical protein TNCV_1894831 [Trichonephila clavipes]|nr:hypothetical protein TNCV_1894831 [Trichonephila clavipes]